METNNNEFNPMPLIYLSLLVIGGFILFYLALTIATILCGVAIAASGYYGYRLAHDPTLWQLRTAQKVAQIEKERELALTIVPEHQQGVVETYYDTKQEDHYRPSTVSVVEDVLDKTKQAFSAFRRRDK